MPAHRGRIVDRAGEPLAISTPVKSIWAFPGQVDATPEKLAQLARVLETTPKALAKKLEDGNDFVFLAKQVPPSRRARRRAQDQGRARSKRIPALLSHGEMSHIGFTGDRDVGQKASSSRSRNGWRQPGSRRVLINRRGEVVEDVGRSGAAAGRDPRSPSTRLQYLAFAN